MTPTKLALKTWYKPDNPLYENPLHPTIKLAGEIGELMDLYGKHKYKPGFDWMNCKWCGNIALPHQNSEHDCWEYVPIVLDELGDIWYYLRIMAWIYNVEFEVKFILEPDEKQMFNSIKEIYHFANIILGNLTSFAGELVIQKALINIFRHLIQILADLDCSLNELTELNYLKLNSDDTNHGWKNAQ